MYQTDRISSWIQSAHEACFLPSPPPDNLALDPHPPTQKRKRAMSLPASASVPIHGAQYGQSPKRRRFDEDEDVLPEQSASQLVALTDRTTFSASRGQLSQTKRSSSPTRETPIMLRGADPPVVVESQNGLRDAPPGAVLRMCGLLAKGVDAAFIPAGLEQIITSDAVVGYQLLRPTDFDSRDQRSAEELGSVWRRVKAVFINARDCYSRNRDENAWCNDVVWPLLHLAIRLYGRERWWLQSVQTQPINPAYLSSVPVANGRGNPTRKVIDRKTDFVLSYSHHHAETSALYARLSTANRDVISHSTDTFTKSTGLFSGFEVKTAHGTIAEAELQMSIWIAASLCKKQELATVAQVPIKSLPDLVEPAVSIVGHEHYIYYAFPQDHLVNGRRGVHILGPDSHRFGDLRTDSIRGIFRLLRLYGNLLEYGMNEEDNGYWGGFFKLVLEGLAKEVPTTHITGEAGG